MTEQEKREKVIRGLESAERDFIRYSGDEYGREYDYAHVELSLVRDAIALLKAQEPRVMTLEEVMSLEENTPLYIEQYDALHGWAVYFGVENGTNDIMTGPPWGEVKYWAWSEYGEYWRCWTSRPTDEQREAVKWE